MINFRRAGILSLALLAVPTIVRAQAASPPPAKTPAFDFSGTLVGSYQYRTDDAAKAMTGGEAFTKFDIGRAYLTFRMPAGENGSIRITTDVYQQTNLSPYYNGWTIRLKYGYYQHDFTKDFLGTGVNAVGRIGMLHTVVVDHMEDFWPRYLGVTAAEQNGYSASSDVGAAALFGLPGKKGEVYLTMVNGSGYASAETNRFKDYAARFTWTPFASESSGILKGLAISPWYSKGWTASTYVLPPNSISDGLQRDRRGVFLGVKDRALTAAVDYSQRIEGVETAAPPARTTDTRTSNLVSVFGIVRPIELFDSKNKSPFGVIARYDNFTSYSNNTSLAAGNTVPDNKFIVAGLFWDLNSKTTLALDYQEMQSTTVVTTFPVKSLFLHWRANF